MPNPESTNASYCLRVLSSGLFTVTSVAWSVVKILTLHAGPGAVSELSGSPPG